MSDATSSRQLGVTIEGTESVGTDRVRSLVSAALARSGVPHADARVRIRADGPVVVQINVDAAGVAPTRVQVSGPTAPTAVAAAVERLEFQLARLDAGLPWPWPDPARRPLALTTPGEVVRTKRVELARISPAEASAVLGAMDYDAHLFTDVHNGEDAVVHRGGPAGVRLVRQRSRHRPADLSAGIVIHPQPTPVLTVAEAQRLLTSAGWPHLFFTDPGSGRGRLLYRRYDGELGLVRPRSEGGRP